ncbi:MAG: hypothetical protein J6C51_06305 [Clostridia bacterium]|nr:hypothetical protein [Clostridia bacterium]
MQEKEHGTAKPGRQRWIVYTVLCSVLAVIAAFTWSASAKYRKETDNNIEVKADTFYFTSDYLTADGTARYELSPGTTEFQFELRNYDGLLVSELDIQYTVSVNGVDREPGNLINGSKNTAVVTVDVAPETEYNIVATGKNGYEKTLSATVTVLPPDTNIYKNTLDEGEYLLLTVWTESVGGDVQIELPDGLIPDATDDDLEGKTSPIDLALGAYQSRSYRFFKTGGYTGGEIKVTHNSNELAETSLD